MILSSYLLLLKSVKFKL